MKPSPDRLRAARTFAGMNQAEWADQLGVTVRAVQKWEGGQTSPRSRYMRDIAELARRPIEWLYDAEEAAV